MKDSLELREDGTQATSEFAMADTQRQGLELHIGSNIFRNTNGVIKIHGKEQLVVESRPDQGLLLLTLDLYSPAGQHIAHLRRNVPAFNRNDRFAITIHRSDGSPADAPWVRMADQTTGDVIIDVRAVSGLKSQITRGRFCSHKGIPVEITPHYCRIGSGTTRFGDIVENRGGSVTLD